MQAISNFGSTRAALSWTLLLATPLPLLAAQIGGRVFLDGNHDAAFNPGEPGLPAITIQLTYAGPDGDFATAGDNQTTSLVTDASGNYNFTGLVAGNYRADLDDATLPTGLKVTSGGDLLTFNGVTATQTINNANYALISSGLNLTLWAVNEADPGNALPRSGSGSPRLYCFTDYTDHSGAHDFLDYGRLVWRDTNGVIQTFAGGDETNAESLAIDIRNGDAYLIVNPASGGFTVPVLFKVNLYALRANAPQVVLTRIGEVRDAGGEGVSSIAGLTFDEANNLLFAVKPEGNTSSDPERLLEINPATAQWASRGLIEGTVGGTPYALTSTDGLEVVPSFNSAGQVTGGAFFGYDQEDHHLYQINPADGSITALVNTVPNPNSDIETIVWDRQLGGMIWLDNGLSQLGIIPLNGNPPVLLSDYTLLGLSNNEATNDLEGAAFFLRGAFPLAAIGNHVWVDSNANGHWDEGEPPVSGVTVQLFFDSNNDGDFADAGEDLPYAITTTSAQGFYDFRGLQAGRFRIGLPASNFGPGQPLATWPISSPVTNTADDRTDADDNGIQAGAGQIVFSPAIVLTEGEIDHTVDFGMIGADYGDAPASYPVLRANNGAWHPAIGPSLGPLRDAEPDGQPSGAASADGADEDGVTVSSFQAGVITTITVNSTASARLDAWVDWNRDGDWNDGGEQVATSSVLTAGNNTVNIAAPPGASPGVSYARFRISSAGGLSPGGGAMDGEAEDYQVIIITTGTIAGFVREDVDNNNTGDIGIPNITLTLLNSGGTPMDGNPGLPGVQPVTATTDANGAYVFAGLVPGTYGVAETQHPGFFSVGDSDGGNPDEIRPIVVAPGGASGGNNFVEERPGAIAGSVQLDLDNDDDGDSFIEGVTVDLYSDPDGNGDPADGSLVGSTTSDNNTGAFTFSHLPPGAYVLIETQPEGYFTATDVDRTLPGDDAPNADPGDNLIPVTVAGGELDDGNEFIEELPGIISGRVRRDLDNDGEGDAPIESVTIELYTDPDGDGDPVDGAFVESAQTSNLGEFSFFDLAPGSYILLEAQPENTYTVTDRDTTFPDDDAPNISTVDDLIPVTIGGGEMDDGNEFVEESPAFISGRVQLDLDNDNVGDTFMEGVTIGLFSDPNGDGNPADGSLLGTTLTNLSGDYSFPDVAPGNYVLVETQPENYFTVTDGDTTNPDDDSPNISTGDNLIPVTVGGGEIDDGNAFVEELPGSIRGRVQQDFDNDGTGDMGLEGVLISLFSDPNGDGDPEDGELLATTLSNGVSGDFSFNDRAPGNYVLLETQPENLFSATDGDTTFPGDDAPNVSTLDNFIPVTIGGGETDDGNNFIEESPGSISGNVGVDFDNDGVSDQPLEGVTVSLFSDPNGDGDPGDGVLLSDTATGPLGFYEFTSLQAGDYVIVETQPAGYFTASDSSLVFDLNDAPNLSPTDNLIPASIRPGEIDSFNDFAEELPGSISGFVKEDTDGDGLGNDPLGSVTISLYSDPNGDGDPEDGELLSDTVTDGIGFYQFTGLQSGSYVVRETQPALYFSVTDGDSFIEEDDAPNVSITDDLIPVFIRPGENDSFNDFVEARPGGLSGSVLADEDNNDTGDSGIANVELLLVDDSGNAVDSEPETPGIQLTTAITDENGFYSFSNLAPGTYGVVETQPAGYLSVGDKDGDDPNFIYLVMVLPSQNSPGNDFIEELPGSFSGRVLADDNNDNTGDTGLEGVTITLLDFTGSPLDGDTETPGVQFVTNQTAPDGTYSFTDLPPGIYGVAEAQPAGYLNVSDRDGGNPDSIHPITVTAAQDNSDNDFIEELPVAIGDFIYADTNANGYHDGGEPGAPPVAVQLLFDANNDGDLDDAGESTPIQTVVSTGGIYHFSNLPPGNYQVIIPVPPAGYTLSSPNRSTADDGQDNDNNGMQAVVGGPTYSPVITLLAGTEADVETDNSDNSTDSTVDFAFTPINPTNWIAWQNLNPLGGQNNPNDNPDGDLNENLIEFAFGYDPKNGVPNNSGGQRGFCLMQNGTGGFYAEVIRPAGLTGLSYTLEYTGELSPSTAWSSNDDMDGITPVITTLSGGFESMRWDNLEGIPALSDGHGFVRIRVEEVDLELQSWTEVQGWLDHRIESQSETCSNPFLKKEIFSATADAGSPANAINVSGSAGNVNVASLLTGRTGLYVEVLRGPHEGHRFAVDPAASDADTIALMPGDAMNTVSPIPDLSDAPIVVRETWRFAEMFPPSLFQSGGDLNGADNILTFNAATQTWTTYLLANLGGFGTYWVNSADFSGMPPANQNTVTFGPAEGFFFHHRGPALTLPLMGIVRENDFRCPLVQGNNLTSGGYPLDQSYTSRGMDFESNAGFHGSTDIRTADQVLFWRGDRAPGLTSYDTFYFLNAGAPYQYWVSAGDNFVTPVDINPDFKAGRAAFIKRTAPLGTYRVKAPWSPAPLEPVLP